jgi:anhydro-N-acetylmuramic acid kinase
LNFSNMVIENANQEFVVLGMMSGTSLDGLDLTVSHFIQNADSKNWSGRIESFCSIPISEEWQVKITALTEASAVEWHKASVEWSKWCAQQIKEFVSFESIDLIVFSGQTVFHRPESGWTGQLGHGAALYAEIDCQVPVVCDLRSLDVSLGGQGAPLVPVADALLYPEYEACLNLGGFANISCSQPIDGSRIAWDIGPCNLVLNQLALRAGFAFDQGGRMAASGKVCEGLWSQWMSIDYHDRRAPKSLGAEWLASEFWPILETWEETHYTETCDALATAVAYIASQIRLAACGKTTLTTGGGAHNSELLKLLEGVNSAFVLGDKIPMVLPAADVIDGKEAHAFGFLGLLRALGRDNVWNSVTGASMDNVGGALWGYFGQRGA